jgi:hypothetical protein
MLFYISRKMDHSWRSHCFLIILDRQLMSCRKPKLTVLKIAKGSPGHRPLNLLKPRPALDRQ